MEGEHKTKGDPWPPTKRYEEVDGVRKEKERLTPDHQPPDHIFSFPSLPGFMQPSVGIRLWNLVVEDQREGKDMICQDGWRSGFNWSSTDSYQAFINNFVVEDESRVTSQHLFTEGEDSWSKVDDECLEAVGCLLSSSTFQSNLFNQRLMLMKKKIWLGTSSKWKWKRKKKNHKSIKGKVKLKPGG